MDSSTPPDEWWNSFQCPQQSRDFWSLEYGTLNLSRSVGDVAALVLTSMRADGDRSIDGIYVARCVGDLLATSAAVCNLYGPSFERIWEATLHGASESYSPPETQDGKNAAALFQAGWLVGFDRAAMSSATRAQLTVTAARGLSRAAGEVQGSATKILKTLADFDPIRAEMVDKLLASVGIVVMIAGEIAGLQNQTLEDVMFLHWLDHSRSTHRADRSGHHSTQRVE